MAIPRLRGLMAAPLGMTSSERPERPLPFTLQQPAPALSKQRLGARLATMISDRQPSSARLQSLTSESVFRAYLGFPRVSKIPLDRHNESARPIQTRPSEVPTPPGPHGGVVFPGTAPQIRESFRSAPMRTGF